MKAVYFIALVTALSMASTEKVIAQIDTVIHDNKRILLFANKTWEYVDTANQNLQSSYTELTLNGINYRVLPKVKVSEDQNRVFKDGDIYIQFGKRDGDNVIIFWQEIKSSFGTPNVWSDIELSIDDDITLRLKGVNISNIMYNENKTNADGTKASNADMKTYTSQRFSVHYLSDAALNYLRDQKLSKFYYTIETSISGTLSEEVVISRNADKIQEYANKL